MVQSHQELLDRIKASKPKILELLADADREFGAPDLFYRFYYQSFKVYRIQDHTTAFLALIKKVADENGLNSRFLEIIELGTNKQFDLSHNDAWLKHTRPLMEAYFHTRMLLDRMLWCADNLEDSIEAMTALPSSWAAVLVIFNLR